MRNSATQAKLRDCDIRAAVLAKLVPTIIGGEPSRVIQEFGLATGAVRVDVAVANGKLHGFEIKSEADTLQRLGAQAAVYNRVFDTVTMVCGQNHVQEVLATTPLWWGIAIAVGTREKVSFKRVRQGRINKCVDAAALVQLLWRDELIKLLVERGVRCTTFPKRKLWEVAASTIPLTQLKEYVRITLKKRRDWRSDSPLV